MLTLLVTAFVPILEIKFAWVELHWMAGLVLSASILYHIIHASFLPGLLVDLDQPRRCA